MSDLGTPDDLARRRRASAWFQEGNRRLHDRALPSSLALLRDVARLEAKLAAMERSLTWRITAPLRHLHSQLLRLAAPEPNASAFKRLAAERVIAPLHGVKRRLRPGPADPFSDYAHWIARDEAGLQAVLPAPMPGTPRLALVLTVAPGTEDTLGPVLDALHGQLSPERTLVAVCADTGGELLDTFAQTEAHAQVVRLPNWRSPAIAKAEVLAGVDADYVGFLDLPDCIAPMALRLIAGAIAQDRQAALLFADEDRLNAEGHRHDPLFKPGFDPDLHAAGDLLGRLVVVRRDLLRQLDLPTDDADWFRVLGQRAVAAVPADRICHVPAVLCHRAAAVGGLVPRWQRVRVSHPDPAPLVSLLVPTRNRGDLLRACADGVLLGTDFQNLELLILDNGSDEPATLDLLRALAARDRRVRVLPLPGPFNWSALNNAGARAATGEILVLLNNDIAMLRHDWLDELVAQAVRADVGAVGAKLLFPDGTLQHAGIVLDPDGTPRHILRRAPDDAAVMRGTFAVAHSVTAVTGACLAIRRATFHEVGGLDEGFAVSCNDVDFCLRLMAHGYRNVWTPFAVLEHREMASRGSDRTPAQQALAAAELERMGRTWGSAALWDPYCNPNLVLVDEQPRLRRRDDVALEP